MTHSPERFKVYAKSWKLACPYERAEERVTAALFVFFQNILHGLEQHGCPCIGHIKALASAGTAGHAAMSVTRYDETLKLRGGFTGDFSEIDLTLNLILVAGPEIDLAKIANAALPDDLSHYRRWTIVADPQGKLTRRFRSAFQRIPPS